MINLLALKTYSDDVWGFPGGSVIKNSPASAGPLGQEDPLEMEMATHSSVIVWEIPWTEIRGVAKQSVRHDWAAKQQMRFYSFVMFALPNLNLHGKIF